MKNEYEQGIYECREQLALWMIDHGYATGHGDSISDLLKELEWQLEEHERKAFEASKGKDQPAIESNHEFDCT